MDCQICINNLEPYLHGEVKPELRMEMEKHFTGCRSCSENLMLARVTEKIIDEEKQLQPDLRLAQRILDLTGETSEQVSEPISLNQKILRTAIYGVSVAAAVYAGIIAGGFYYNELPENEIPAEMTYMNDVHIEAVNLFLSE